MKCDIKKAIKAIEIVALVTVLAIRLLRGDLNIGIGIEMK